MNLSELSIHAHLQQNKVLTESGRTTDLRSHLFLFDPYRDMSAKQVIMKAAQIGFSTLAINKALWISKNLGISIIYTLPTETDRNAFVGGKVNRIIRQNPIYQQWVKDKDSIEQKAVGNSIVYFQGTFSKKAAIMTSSDLNIYDEVDTSNQSVIEEYSTRLQHSDYKWEWYFSHPSAENYGVDKYWKKSDQKHWFITCDGCGKEQYLDWPESIDKVRRCFQCKFCFKELSERERTIGRWVKKKKDREFSGYWIPLLICPWVSAGEIVDYYNEKSGEYFYNKVLGKPYVGGGNKLGRKAFWQNLTDGVPDLQRNRVVIGVDTGKDIHLVCGTAEGLFYNSTTTNYDELEYLLTVRFPNSVAIIDQGGDLIKPRELREKFPGRVFLCTYRENNKKDVPTWGKKDEAGTVMADRNRTIQQVVDEFTDHRIPIFGEENDWYDVWLHANNLTRKTEVDEETGAKRKIWVRSGPDHFFHAIVYWRIGVSRFGATFSVATGGFTGMKETPVVNPDNTTSFNPRTMFKKKTTDWRKS